MGDLPGFLFRFEDVDFAVFLGKGIVVAWGETNPTGMIAKVDAWKAMVGSGRHGGICHSPLPEAAVERHHHGLLGHYWCLGWKSGGPGECRALVIGELGVLHHACWLAGEETRWGGTDVEAVEGVVTYAGHEAWVSGARR